MRNELLYIFFPFLFFSLFPSAIGMRVRVLFRTFIKFGAVKSLLTFFGRKKNQV